MKNTVIVTSLYGDKCIENIKYLLLINVPIILYVPDNLESLIRQITKKRPYQTKLIIKNPIKDKDGTISQKISCLKEVSDMNFFDSHYFVWVDCNIFDREPCFKYDLVWPDQYKIRILDDRFLISDYVFGGNKLSIEILHHELETEGKNLEFVVENNPQYYYVWDENTVVYELAVGTKMTKKYRINPNITLLTLATKEVPYESYQWWEITADYYGYNYKILGRSDSWKGFSTKAKTYIEGLKEVTTEYCILTDSTDLFFVGSSDEAYDKIIAEERDIIIGGEMGYYCPGLHDPSIVKQYILSIAKSPQKFVNSGFIIGKTDEIIKLIYSIIPYENDQTGCYEFVYSNKDIVKIDYETKFVGNIIKPKKQSVEYFYFDENTQRYRSKLHDTAPIVLHFPGKAFGHLLSFYNKSNFNLPLSSSTLSKLIFFPTCSNPQWCTWVLSAVVIILLFVLLFVNFKSFND